MHFKTTQSRKGLPAFVTFVRFARFRCDFLRHVIHFLSQVRLIRQEFLSQICTERMIHLEVPLTGARVVLMHLQSSFLREAPTTSSAPESGLSSRCVLHRNMSLQGFQPQKLFATVFTWPLFWGLKKKERELKIYHGVRSQPLKMMPYAQLSKEATDVSSVLVVFFFAKDQRHDTFSSPNQTKNFGRQKQTCRY